jgi:hypothetical protein
VTVRKTWYAECVRLCQLKCLTTPDIKNIWRYNQEERSRVSSGSIVSDYGLDDRAIGVRSPAGVKDFSSIPVSRPDLGPTQPPVQWVPEVLSPGVKLGRGVMLTTHLI